jgi:hypothetical protein
VDTHGNYNIKHYNFANTANSAGIDRDREFGLAELVSKMAILPIRVRSIYL